MQICFGLLTGRSFFHLDDVDLLILCASIIHIISCWYNLCIFLLLCICNCTLRGSKIHFMFQFGRTSSTVQKKKMHGNPKNVIQFGHCSILWLSIYVYRWDISFVLTDRFALDVCVNIFKTDIIPTTKTTPHQFC